MSERDVDALVKYLEVLIGDYLLRVDMGEQARQKVYTEFNSTIQNEKLESYFSSVINHVDSF